MKTENQQQPKQIQLDNKVIKDLYRLRFFIVTLSVQTAKNGDVKLTEALVTNNDSFFSRKELNVFAEKKIKEKLPKAKITGDVIILLSQEITHTDYMKFLET